MKALSTTAVSAIYLLVALLAAAPAPASTTAVRVDGWDVNFFFPEGHVVRAGYYTPGGGSSPGVIDFGEVRVGTARTIMMAVCIDNNRNGGTVGMVYASGSTHFYLPSLYWSDPEFPPPYCRAFNMVFAPRVGGYFEAHYYVYGISNYIGFQFHHFRIVGRGRW